jgi:transcriptional regulator of acetoin/glycerol metabolism
LQRRYRPNILIIGSGQAAQDILDGIRRTLEGSIETRELPGALNLPNGDCGALILHSVGDLTEAQQLELTAWVEKTPTVPVVSTHRTSLYVLVTKGKFSERLYYRLNTVLEDASPGFRTAN